MQPEYRLLFESFHTLLSERFGENLVSIVLFGSVASGSARRDSDMDVCLVIRGLPKSRFQRNRLISPLLWDLKATSPYQEMRRQGYFPEVSPILYTPEEVKDTKPIFLDMVEEGEILRDDGTMRRKLDDIKGTLKVFKSRKVILDDGSWYWELKPGMRLGEVIDL